MYTVDEIKELLRAVDDSSVTELKMENTEEKLVIRKEVVVAAAPQAIITAPTLEQAQAAQPQNNTSPSAEPCGKTVDSPMAGVFYAAPSPDAEAYVKAGKAVKEGDILCIVEAMKLMNEITANESGTIKEILVENGQIVEFGQPLFLIG